MTIQEEIEKLKTQLAQATDEHAEAEIIISLLRKKASVNIKDAQPYVDRLLQLGKKLNYNIYQAWGLYYLAFINRLTAKYDASLKFSHEALSIFMQTTDLRGMANTYTNIGNIYYHLRNYHEALKNYLLALPIRIKLGSRGEIASSYNNIGTAYQNLNNYPEALKNILRSLHIREEIGDKWGMAHSYSGIGLIQKAQRNYLEALKNHLQALQIREAIGDRRGAAYSYHHIGVIHEYLGNYPQSMKNFLQSLKIKEELGDKRGLSDSYNNIGAIQQNNGNYDEALKNFLRAIKISEEIGDKNGAASPYFNIGNIYFQRGNYEDALKNYSIGLQINESVGDSVGIASVCNNMGDVYIQQNNYEEALKSYLRLFNIAQQLNDRQLLVVYYNSIGRLFFRQGNLAEALKNKLLSLQLSEEIGNKELIKESALSISHTYKALHDFENALKYHEKYHQVESEMLGEQAQKQLTDLNFMHNMEQKEKDAAFEKQKREEAERFRKIVEAKNMEIVQSINYAAKIQNAILPPLETLTRHLPDSFVLHLSKDIVSGDFYFFDVNAEYLYLAVVDCTGHGVPGAMVSIVGHAGLKRAIDEFKLSQPAEILLKLNEILTATLHQSGDEDTLSDGMDIAFCRLDLKKNQLLYAGANRPLWLLRNGEMLEYKPTKTAIGGMKYEQDRRKNFIQQEIRLQTGDSLYIFSDGYADQFGGEKGKKMMVRNFKETIRSVQHKSMDEQKTHLHQHFHQWKGEHEQVDDVLVIGVRI